uniref:Solute carrier family 15 member 3 n=1 Tax=Calidris pygmaea TaxID=425635 RepID=A0A8C3JM66_9CHAR
MGDGGERSPLLGMRTTLKGRGVACVAVLVVEGLERAAFFGITANLVLYLTSSTFGWGGTQASCACLLFLGASYLLSPMGGWLADVYLGRYATVAISFLVYLLAASLLPVTATLDGRLSVCGQLPAATTQNCSWHHGGTCRGQPPQQYCAPTIYTSLLVLALGVSSVRANLTPFGADQVRDQGGDATRRFFNWFYWSINLGAVFSLLVVAFVQQNISFLAGYLIPVACLVLALLIFLLATPTFVTKPPTGSQVSAMIKLALQSCGCTSLGGTGTRTSRWDPGDPVPTSGAQPGAPSPEEDLANFQVLARILPVMLTFIPYWMVYFQMQSTFYLQGLHLHIPSIFQRGQDHTSTLQSYTVRDGAGGPVDQLDETSGGNVPWDAELLGEGWGLSCLCPPPVPGCLAAPGQRGGLAGLGAPEGPPHRPLPSQEGAAALGTQADGHGHVLQPRLHPRSR